MTDTRQMIRSANPVPTGAELLSDGELDALLHLTMQRSTDMDLTERPALDTQQPRSRWNGWPIALAAFAVVIVVGVVLLIAPGDDTPPVASTTTSEAPTTTEAPEPTTTSSTTTTEAPDPTPPPTTEAPDVDPDDLTAIEDFVATFNAGDWEATLASLTPDAEVANDLIGGQLRLDESPDPISRLLRMWSAQETRMTIRTDSCEPVEDGLINCRGTFSDVIVDQSPFGEAGLSVTFGVEPGGAISHLIVNSNAPSMVAAYGFFFSWLDETHPGDSDILAEATGLMSLRDDALELLPIRTAEWIASLDQ
ncbi:MAG: hypothetical protein R3246_08090 [Acidimicrobiia bacterium]|nr:hypothetical protein [Acidimicrobiia bacterium]